MDTKKAIEIVKNLTTTYINYLDLDDSEIIKAEKEEKEIIELLSKNEVIK